MELTIKSTSTECVFVSHKNISVSDVKICGFSISVNPVSLGFGGLFEAQNGKVSGSAPAVQVSGPF